MSEDVTVTRTKDPLAGPGAPSRRLRVVVIVAVIGTLIAVMGVLFATKRWPFGGGSEQTVEFVSSDGTRVTVRAHVIAGSLRIITAPEAPASTTWRPLTPAVRIEAEGLEGSFKMTFEPGPTWKNAMGPEALCLSPAAGPTPLGSEVLSDGSVAAETTCDTVTVGESDGKQVQSQVSNPLDRPANLSDPLAVALLADDRHDTSCTTDQILVGVKGANDSEPLCVEYIAERGTYRLAYANWDNAPYLFTLPDKVTRTPGPTATPATAISTPEAQNSLLSYIVGERGARRALVSRAGTLEASYPPGAATQGATVIGRPDVTGWILYALRENIVATAGLNANKKRMSQAVALVDESIAADSVTQCATNAAASLGDASTVSDAVEAVRSGYAACLPAAVTSLAGVYARFNGGNAERIEKGISTTMTPAAQQVKRAENAFRGLLMDGAGGVKASDLVTRTLATPRFMTKEEVFAMPLTPPRETDNYRSRCPAPPGSGALRPIGVAPVAECLYVMEADMDGNGRADRALTWTSGRPGGVGGGPQVPVGGQQGAVVYLDDGRTATLPANVAQTKGLSDFELLSIDQIANDRRGYMVVEYELGAHTVWLAFLGLSSEGQLNFVANESGDVFSLALDSAARSAAGYGCYSRDGHGRLADWDWSATGVAERNLNRVAGDLTVTPMEINGLVVKKVGGDLTYATPGHAATVSTPVGRPCKQADPAQRGSFAVNIPGAITRVEKESQSQAAAQRALNAITSGDANRIRSAFVPEARAQALEMARTVGGMSSLRKGMTCNWVSVTNELGLSQEASCNATFQGEMAWLDVSVGRGADGKYQAVGADFWAD